MADRRLSILVALADAGRAEDIAAYLGEEGIVRQVDEPVVAETSTPPLVAGEEQLS